MKRILLSLTAGLWLLALPGARSSFAASSSTEPTWLRILHQEHRMKIEAGHGAQFDGFGSLKLEANRRIIEYPASAVVTVDGRTVTGEHDVEPGEVVRIQVGEAGQWEIRHVAPSAFPRQTPGTRISDDDERARSAVDTTEPMRFFLETRPDGKSHFFIPDPQP